MDTRVVQCFKCSVPLAAFTEGLVSVVLLLSASPNYHLLLGMSDFCKSPVEPHSQNTDLLRPLQLTFTQSCLIMSKCHSRPAKFGPGLKLDLGLFGGL